ncbi:MAG: YigZ family protein [Clostridia bacterium]|nr:YigZ family protein [Clostridia bacterium]
MQKLYKTVKNAAGAEIEEKKSRFIASVKPVNSEEEALDFISMLKSKYWDASHNVYAYYIGGNNIIQRFSDDGEPSGTAGLPVLEVIKRMELQDLVVVVTRYFGGILLGAAGLIRAYSKSASAGIEAAGIITRQLCTEVSIMLEYTLFGKVQNVLMSKGYSIESIIYAQDIDITVYIPAGTNEEFIKLISDTTNGRALVEFKENTYITLYKE